VNFPVELWVCKLILSWEKSDLFIFVCNLTSHILFFRSVVHKLQLRDNNHLKYHHYQKKISSFIIVMVGVVDGSLILFVLNIVISIELVCVLWNLFVFKVCSSIVISECCLTTVYNRHTIFNVE
jgi:hypothetical protein